MEDIDYLLRANGLTDILSFDTSIISDVRYSTKNNFSGDILYPRQFGLYTVKPLAEAVWGCSRLLKHLFPELRVVIFDAARPLSVQRRIFEKVKGTSFEPYIANPEGEVSGGFHNYGLAIDLSICHADGGLLDMGSDYDSFEPVSHPGRELEFLEKGILNQEAYSNRMLLYFIAARNGITPHPKEWWHFQLDYSESSKSMYKLLDF